MNDFLYFILITKLYGQGNNIFYLSKSIQIYVEIPNSFINFFDKFPILNIFSEKNKKLLNSANLEPLIVPNDVYSNERIVALYLKLLKEKDEKNPKRNRIDVKTIVFPNTPDDIIYPVEIGDSYYKSLIINAVDENNELTQEKCQELIFEELNKLIKTNHGEDLQTSKITYYQISTFINILAEQLKKFNNNRALSASTILDTKGLEEKCLVRSLIVKNFIKLSNIFSKGSFTQLINEQNEAQNLIRKKISRNENINEANQIIENFKHEQISFYLIDYAFVLFHGGNDMSLFSIITNKKNTDKEYKDLLDFINMQSLKNVSKQIDIKEEDEIKKEKYLAAYNNDFVWQLKDYTTFNNEQFLKELGEILGIKDSNIEIEDGNKKIQKKLFSYISENYEFTVDNFFKLCLIILRIRANIPIILMGETGCGKTSLIKVLSQLQNEGQDDLNIENIHAGHNDKDIINFIKSIIPKAEKLIEEQKIIKEKYEKVGETYEERKLLVFFDELNTCKSMDLLSEIICKNSCQGTPLPKNIAFIGAANPYRKAKKKNVGLKIFKDYNNYDETDLVYNVNPMPHSLLNYVLDFGSLSPNDEEKYIKKMINKEIKDNNFLDIAKELIIKAQNFIRDSLGISSVSLREVERFIIFYKFFLNYLNKRKEFEIIKKFRQDIDYSELDEELIKLFSINLSIYLGYYLRLSDYEDDNKGATRQTLVEKLDEMFKSKLKEYNPQLIKVFKNNRNANQNPDIDIDFLFFPELEENFIADNLELDKGIAKNRALLENLFSLFVAVNTKIPIFIIGKPGSSKSLSVQLISKAMNRKENPNSFFKMFKKMHITTYQGSLNSTSKEVEKTFENAREFLKIKDKDKKISVIFIDEMGLAEHSPHNPLKVIHKELDRNKDEKNEDDKIAFVGISNWTFDSAKINRGISINIPDSNETDIKKTSETIAESYLGTILKNNKTLSSFFDNLALTYYKYKLEFKEKLRIRKYENFHGKRDFYHLIKYSATKVKKLLNDNNIERNQIIDEQKLIEIAIKSLGRNFGGLEFKDINSTGLKLIINKFVECNSNNHNIKTINENLNLYNEIKVKIHDNLKEKVPDYLSRYILLITKSNIGIYLLSSFLNSDEKLNNYTIIIGSKFRDDLNKIEYSSKILSKIKMNLEKDSILVLKDLDTIYPSLYDLFNQNFLTIQRKKFARIALSNKTNSFSHVNDNFRCIIIVDENKLIYQEIPFLSRFEKQSLSFEYLMNKEQKSQAEKIYKKCQKLVEYDKKWKFINYDIDSLLINCGEEEVNGMVYLENSDKIEDILSEKISSTLPQDIILILSKMMELRTDKENIEFYNKILNNYCKNRYNNIKSLIENINIFNYNKIIIYTFTRIIEKIKTEKDNKIKELKVLSVKNELEFEEEIKEFFENNELEFFILKFTPNEFSYIDYLKSLIENLEKLYQNKKEKDKINNKVFIFTFHLERIFKENELSKENEKFNKKKMLCLTLSNLAKCEQTFIDDLNGKEYLDKNKNLTNIREMIKVNNSDLYKIFFNKKEIFLDCLEKCLITFSYEFTIGEMDKKKYIEDLKNLLDKLDLDLVEEINNLIIKNLESENINKDNNIFSEILEKGEIQKEDICILDLVSKKLLENYFNQFKKIYSSLENNFFFSAILNNKHKYDNNDEKYCFDNVENKNLYEKIKKVFINHINIKNENLDNINIFIGYNLPSKELIEEIKRYISDYIVKNYILNEKLLREILKEELLEKKKQQYEKNLKILSKNPTNIFLKNEIIKEFTPSDIGIRKKFYELILKDYLLFFIIDNNIEKDLKTINEILKFMRIILANKNKCEYKDIHSDIGKIIICIIWIESYSEELETLIKFFRLLYSYEKSDISNLIEKIENYTKKFEDEYNKYNVKINEQIVNKTFYILIGSLIRILIFDCDLIISNIECNQKLIEFKNELNYIYNSLSYIDNHLYLHCKEIILLHKIIEIISLATSDNNKIDTQKKIITDFIKSFCENTVNNKDDELNLGKKDANMNIDSLINKFYNYYDYFKEKNIDKLDKIFSSIIYDEFIWEENKDHKKYLLEVIILKEGKFFLIKNNILLTKLLKLIIGEKIKPKKEYIDKVFNIFTSRDNDYLALINDSDNMILEEEIIKIFNSIINLYFDSLENVEEKITSDLFTNFRNSIQKLEILDIKDKEKNNKLICLFGICFINLFITKFIEKIKENTNIFKGNENKIINEISSSKILSDTLKLYILILIKKKNLYLENLSNFEDIKNFANNLKNEFGIKEYDEMLTSGKIPDKDNYRYNKYFEFYEYPSFENFKKKFETQNKGNYPLIEEYINNKEANNLKYLIDYVNFVNTMINYYSGVISRSEAEREERKLYNEEIYKDKKFKEKFDNFEKIYNIILKRTGKEKLDESLSLAHFFNDDLDKNGKYIEEDLKKFVEIQNSFLRPIIEVYEKKKDSLLNCYIKQLKQEVDIQSVTNSQILHLENCFEKSNFINLNELIYIYSEKDNDSKESTYNYEKIEEELAQILLPNKCLLSDKNLKYIIYKNESYKLEKNNPLINYENIYGREELQNEEKKKIFNYIRENYKFYDESLNDSFILLFNYLTTYQQEKETKINDLINDENNEEKRYIRFDIKLSRYFNEEGKEITTGKLLTSFLYMEKLCFGFLKRENDNNINNKLSQIFSLLDDKYKKLIVDYFKKGHNDKIITKNKLAIALRRFIIRYLSAFKDKYNNNLYEMPIFELLKKPDLWDNEIIKKMKDLKDFQKKIKEIEECIGSFKNENNKTVLKCQHAYDFYKIIGKEDEESIINEISEFESKVNNNEQNDNNNNEQNDENNDEQNDENKIEQDNLNELDFSE